MNFQNSISTCFSKIFDFGGRASRSEFWWFVLFVFALGSVASYFMVNSYQSNPNNWFRKDNSGKIVDTVTFLIYLLVLSAACRRLHDIGKSGWWLSIVIVPTFASSLLSLITDSVDLNLLKLGVGLCVLAGSILLFIWLVKRSSPEKNRYGDPLHI